MTESRGIRSIPNGHWNEVDNGMAAMQSVIDIIGRYPTIKEANEYLPGLITSVRRRGGPYDSWFDFKDKMGYGENLPRGYWKDVDNGMAAMAGLIDVLGGGYPTQNEAERYLPNLVYAIKRNHGPYGGWESFRETMGYESEVLPRRYWNDLDNIMGAMQSLIDIFGRYPTNIEVRKNLPSLAYAISRKNGPCGGWNKFKEMMGHGDGSKLESLPRNYWNDKDNGMGAMASVVDIFGRYPKFDEANKYLPGLVTAIKKKDGPYGGWFRFKEEMGYSEKDPTEKFISDMKMDDMKTLCSILGINRGRMWDVLSVMYKVPRKEVVELAKNEPSLAPYMGEFVTGITNIEDWDYIADRTLPYDDERGTIRKILEKSLFDSVVSRLGPTPNMKYVDKEIRTLISHKK